MAEPAKPRLADLKAVGPEGVKNADLLGRTSMIACIMGAAGAAILFAFAPPAGQQAARAVFAPFLGCEIVAFVTGVFARDSLLGKAGMLFSVMLFLAFFAAMHDPGLSAPPPTRDSPRPASQNRLQRND